MAIVTISRQFGAGGITVGGMIAEKLGYLFYDNEIIQLVAQKARVSPSWVKTMEKEAGTTFHRFMMQVVPKGLVNKILNDERGYIDEEIYLDLLNLIIKKIADEGNAVIIGRGGQYILADHPDTIHVLLVAEKEDRIRFIEKKYGISLKQAAQVIHSDDRHRMNLYQKFHHEDYDSPVHYHVTINTSRLSREKAADLICRLIELKQTWTPRNL